MLKKLIELFKKEPSEFDKRLAEIDKAIDNLSGVDFYRDAEAILAAITIECIDTNSWLEARRLHKLLDRYTVKSVQLMRKHL